MTKYQVNGGDKSERGDKAISPEVKWKPAGNKGKHIEGQRTVIVTVVLHDFRLTPFLFC